MIELVEDQVIPEEEGNDYASMFNECLVDLKKELAPIEPIVHVGFDYKGNNVAALTRFECSCIYAPSKAKKSFAKSLIEAAYIGGNTSPFTLTTGGTVVSTVSASQLVEERIANTPAGLTLKNNNLITFVNE